MPVLLLVLALLFGTHAPATLHAHEVDLVASTAAHVHDGHLTSGAEASDSADNRHPAADVSVDHHHCSSTAALAAPMFALRLPARIVHFDVRTIDPASLAVAPAEEPPLA